MRYTLIMGAASLTLLLFGCKGSEKTTKQDSQNLSSVETQNLPMESEQDDNKSQWTSEDKSNFLANCTARFKNQFVEMKEKENTRLCECMMEKVQFSQSFSDIMENGIQDELLNTTLSDCRKAGVGIQKTWPDEVKNKVISDCVPTVSSFTSEDPHVTCSCIFSKLETEYYFFELPKLEKPDFVRMAEECSE